MRFLVLKASATMLMLGTTMLAAVYVTSHLKNPAAPLQPMVLTAGHGATANAAGGSLTIGPSVQKGDVAPVTSTYAS